MRLGQCGTHTPHSGAELLLILRSEEHTSELQSQSNLVCRLLLEKKKKEENKYIAQESSDDPDHGSNPLLDRRGQSGELYTCSIERCWRRGVGLVAHASEHVRESR